jgi:hypothetical protein
MSDQIKPLTMTLGSGVATQRPMTISGDCRIRSFQFVKGVSIKFDGHRQPRLAGSVDDLPDGPRSKQNAGTLWRSSHLEEAADVPVAYRAIREGEGATFAYFPGSAEKGPEGDPAERAADADTLHPNLRKLGHAQLDPSKPHENVYRAIDGSKGNPALVVASASKAKRASSRAVPMSHGLEMTNALSRSWSARNVLPLSA